MTETLRKIPKWVWLLVAVVILAALAINGWSMFTLGIDFGMPKEVAAVASAIYDVGAAVLMIYSIYYAMSNKSSLITEMFTFVFVSISAWIQWEHAELLNLPTVGKVFFASASIVLAVILKATLSYLTHHSREKNGRTVDHIPTVGVLTWILMPGQVFKLLKLVAKDRLYKGSSGLVRQVETVDRTPETPVRTTGIWGATDEDIDIALDDKPSQAETREISAPSQREIGETPFEIPENWNEKTSGREIARVAIENGVENPEMVYEIAVRIKGPSVRKDSIAKALWAAQKELAK